MSNYGTHEEYLERCRIKKAEEDALKNPSIYDKNENRDFGIMCLAIVTVMGLAIGGLLWTEYNLELDSQKLQEEFTCNELYIIYNDSTARLSAINDAVNEKCIKPNFPDIDGIPTEVDILRYFTKLDCDELGDHVVNMKFKYKTAIEIYHIQCDKPLNFNTKAMSLVETPETWVKSDESSY